MTADRFGAIANGEYTALASVRDDRAHRLEQSAPDVDPGNAPAEPHPAAGAAPSTGGAAPSSASPSARPGWRPIPPPQHGAWAFLIVPVLCGFAVAGATLAGWLFLAAWVCAYPVGYYLGRGLTARVRRGSWTRLARRERSRAVPWAVITAALGLPLAMTRPWLLGVAAPLALLWGLGLWVAARRGERSLSNDLMLVAQAAVALPLSVAVVTGVDDLSGALAGPTLQATAVVAAYLAGSVLHVKSLLREAGNTAYRRANVIWHGALVVASALLSPWWLVGTAPALLRAILLRPGLRPGVIGGVETIVAVLVVVAAFLAM